MHWTRAVLLGLDWLWALAGMACVVLAAAAAFTPARLRPAPRQAHLWTLGLAFPALCALLKLAQLRGWQAMWDSGVTLNLAWNALHGYGVHSSVLGDRSYFSVHFAFLAALLSPALAFGAEGLAALQGAAAGTAPLAVFLLARRETKDPHLPWAAALVALSHPLYKAVTGAVLDNSVFALPLFLWAACAWESGRRKTAVALCLLLLTTREQVPFILAGIGLYQLTRRRPVGVALVLASAALWFAETAVIRRASEGWACADYWGMFREFGGSREAVLRTALFSPWKFALALVLPPAKLLTPLSALAHAAFLPLAGGAALLPALAAWLPHQLAPADSAYHALNAHASVFVLGPLLWATAKGLGRFRHKHLLAFALGVSALGFLGNERVFDNPGLIPSAWRMSAPKALAAVPSDAAVWCDEYLLPQLALRRYVKALPLRLPDCAFEPGLFVPDRVVLSAHWAHRADPGSRDRILDFLKDRGFTTVFQGNDLLVLAKSSPSTGAPKPAVIP